MNHCETEPKIKTSKATYSIALVGNPNTGKTTLMNSLCGTKQKTGNYPGVTIEKKIGILKYEHFTVEVNDLPGLYSLNAITPDEKIARDFLLGRISGEKQPDLIVVVLDALNLKRNLFLYSQIAELGIPIIAVLTMKDMLEEAGKKADVFALKKLLDAEVIEVDARVVSEVQKLRNKIKDHFTNPISKPNISIPYPVPWKKILEEGKEKFHLTPQETEEVFFSQETIFQSEYSPEIYQWVSEVKKNFSLQKSHITRSRYLWAEKVEKEAIKTIGQARPDYTRKVDNILTHRFWGFLIFLGIMFFMFRSIYAWAEPVMDLIENTFSAFAHFASSELSSYPLLASLLSDGVISGVGSVVTFLPQIIILFLFVAVLEDSGYLARAAFMMDKLLSWTGLNGRSFIPLLSSFACAVPGIMSARVMPDWKTRVSTILIAPLMSCSARLPVYILFIGAFIEPRFGPAIAAVTLFLMHLIGPIISLPIAYWLNKGVLKTKSQPFVLEMPPYRRPAIRSIFHRVYNAAAKFLTRAGTIIFIMSLIIWGLTTFPQTEAPAKKISQWKLELGKEATQDKIETLKKAYQLENSYLGMAGKWIQPVFAPLGYDWKLSVGILSSFPARETIIATLGIIYRVGEESDADLRQKLVEEKKPDGTPLYTPLVAISLMVFFALSMQCMSTLATVMKELNSYKWSVFLFSYMTILAYVVSLLVYQGGKLLGFS